MHCSHRTFSQTNQQSVFHIRRDGQRAQRGAFISVGKFIVVSAPRGQSTTNNDRRTKRRARCCRDITQRDCCADRRLIIVVCVAEVAECQRARVSGRSLIVLCSARRGRRCRVIVSPGSLRAPPQLNLWIGFPSDALACLESARWS